MSEIILCNRPLSMDYLKKTCGIDSVLAKGTSCQKPESLSPFTPYLNSDTSSVLENQIMALLSPPNVSKNLTNLSLTLGGDNVVALAEISKQLQEFNVGMMGTSTSAYADRMGSFAKSVTEYQKSVMNVRDASKLSKAQQILAEQRAMRAFDDMQIKFRHELSSVTAGVKARRGTPMTNPQRAINIAKSSRSVAKLDVVSQVQANNLVKFSQHAKVLSKGVAVIDFSSRIGNIKNEYDAGGNWERQMFIESSSFAVSAAAGTAVANVGAAALGFLVVATPIGWVGLVVGGVVVAGAAAATSIGFNNAMKNNSGAWYDSIMEALGG